jgi:hypothetical protein
MLENISIVLGYRFVAGGSQVPEVAARMVLAMVAGR